MCNPYLPRRLQLRLFVLLLLGSFLHHTVAVGGISLQTLTKSMSLLMWKKQRLDMCLHLQLRRYIVIIFAIWKCAFMILELKTLLDSCCQLLVLGGNGFVGSHVCKEALDRGLSVSSLSRYSVIDFDCCSKLKLLV